MKEDTHSGSARIVMLLCWILSLAVLVIEAVDGRLDSTKELDTVFFVGDTGSRKHSEAEKENSEKRISRNL